MRVERYYDSQLTPSLEAEIEKLRNPPPERIPLSPWWVDAGFLFVLVCALVAWMAFCGWAWDAFMELFR